MNQEKLEEKVQELFVRQDFKVSREGNMLEALKEGNKLVLKVFSSEKYTVEQVLDSVSGEEKVFIDEGLEEVQETIEEASIIREKDDKEEYDLPSYELIGEIAVINELTVDEDEAIEGILEHHPSVKTILLKEESLQGEFRVGEYRKLYGGETETIHKEFGCRFKVDPTKVYYSERFSTERKRVVDQIDDGETVLVMFAGVGPFAIMAARLANPEKVVAIEKNPVAAGYLKENIQLNEVGEIVEGYKGDVREIVPELREKFDRVIMPLPEKADEFLDLAKLVSKSGSQIYLYSFDSQDIRERVNLDSELNLIMVSNSGQIGPRTARLCYNLEIK